MSQQLQQLLKQQLTVPEILREYGRQFTQSQHDTLMDITVDAQSV